MTWRYLNWPPGPVIRKRCVITMSTMDGVKTQSHLQGPSLQHTRGSAIVFARIIDLQLVNLGWIHVSLAISYQSIITQGPLFNNSKSVIIFIFMCQSFSLKSVWFHFSAYFLVDDVLIISRCPTLCGFSISYSLKLVWTIKAKFHLW